MKKFCIIALTVSVMPAQSICCVYGQTERDSSSVLSNLCTVVSGDTGVDTTIHEVQANSGHSGGGNEAGPLAASNIASDANSVGSTETTSDATDNVDTTRNTGNSRQPDSSRETKTEPIDAASLTDSRPETNGGGKTQLKGTVKFSCFVENTAYPDDVRCKLASLLAESFDSAVRRDSNYNELEAMQLKGRSASKKLRGFISDICSDLFTIDSRSDSKSGAQIALKDAVNLEHVEPDAARYLLQRRAEQIHSDLTTLFLQLASLTSSPSVSDLGATATGKKLSLLCGQESCDKVVALLRTIAQVDGENGQPAKTEPKEIPLDFESIANRIGVLCKAAALDDPVMLEVTAELSRLSSPGKAKNAIANVLNVAFELIAFGGPGFGIPALAETGRLLTIQATGGSEQSNLLHEIWLLKRLDSRAAAIARQVQSCVWATQAGRLQKNNALVITGNALLTSLTRLRTVRKVASTSVAAPNSTSCSSKPGEQKLQKQQNAGSAAKPM